MTVRRFDRGVVVNVDDKRLQLSNQQVALLQELAKPWSREFLGMLDRDRLYAVLFGLPIKKIDRKEQGAVPTKAQRASLARRLRRLEEQELVVRSGVCPSVYDHVRLTPLGKRVSALLSDFEAQEARQETSVPEKRLAGWSEDDYERTDDKNKPTRRSPSPSGRVTATEMGSWAPTTEMEYSWEPDQWSPCYGERGPVGG